MYQTEIYRVEAFIIASFLMHMHCNSNMGTSAKSLHIMLVTETGTTEIQMHKIIKQARHNRGTCTATSNMGTSAKSLHIMSVTETGTTQADMHNKIIKQHHDGHRNMQKKVKKPHKINESIRQASSTNRQQQSRELNGKK